MSGGRILIVEDERIARENLDYVLKRWGYDTIAVDSGVRACKELEGQEFDLVLTDLRMPEVDGMQVLERTKELYPDTEVVVMTAFATVSTAVEAMQKGAYHYLSKPYKIEEVRILVRKALEKRRLRLEVADLKRRVQDQQAAGQLLLFQGQPRQNREFRTLEENEKEYVFWVLNQVGGNKTRAAEILGIDRVSLWRKLKRYDVQGES